MTIQEEVSIESVLDDFAEETREIQAERLLDTHYDRNSANRDLDTAYETATQAIKDIFVEEMLSIIGDDDTEVRGSTQNPNNSKYWTRKTTNRNELRAEQRAALIKKYGKN